MTEAAPKRSSGSYFTDTQDLLTSVVLVLPLFVAYQIGVLTTGGIRNGVDFMTSALLMLVGNSLAGYLAVNVGVLLALLTIVAISRRRRSFRHGIWKWVLLESAFYAFFFASAVKEGVAPRGHAPGKVVTSEDVLGALMGQRGK